MVLERNIVPKTVLEKWKGRADEGNVFGPLLTDISKGFDCLSNDLIIAKLNACGLAYLC